jgi:hypothetical protein
MSPACGDRAPSAAGEAGSTAKSQHLFTDSSLPSYEADAVALVMLRSRELLDRLS